MTANHPEHLNTPRLVANDNQQTVWKWDQQEPFGANACNPDPDGDNVEFEFNLRFPGQYFDRETNAHYNYFRDYDPSLGRYVQSDPIGLRGGLNTYGYVAGRPLSMTDPRGLLAISPTCSSGQRRELERAEREVWRVVNASCGGCDSRNAGCVPCSYVNRLRNALETTVVRCAANDGTGNCAYEQGGAVTFLTAGLQIGCGCTESTLLHELLHVIGLGVHDHPEINALERRCFGCAQQRQGIPAWVPPSGYGQ